MTVNDFKETTCATANQDDISVVVVEAVIQPLHTNSENLLGRVLAGNPDI